MTITQDNQLAQQASGAADWDSGLNDNFGILERGYHTTAQAGVNINSGYVTWLGSGGFMLPYDPNSAAIAPTAISFTAPSSGESQLFLLAGIVRSMYLSFIPGQQYYVSMTTPGLLVTTPNGIPVGQGMTGGGFHFRPRPGLVSSAQVPVGGNSGDVLTKSASNDYATGWQPPAAGAVKPTLWGYANADPKNGQNLNAPFYAAVALPFPTSFSISHVCFFTTNTAANTNVAPALYRVGADGVIGLIVATGPTVNGLKQGLNELPLASNFVVGSDQALYVGMTVVGSNFNMGAKATTQALFFSITSVTAVITPAASTVTSQNWAGWFAKGSL